MKKLIMLVVLFSVANFLFSQTNDQKLLVSLLDQANRIISTPEIMEEAKIFTYEGALCSECSPPPPLIVRHEFTDHIYVEWYKDSPKKWHLEIEVDEHQICIRPGKIFVERGDGYRAYFSVNGPVVKKYADYFQELDFEARRAITLGNGQLNRIK